MLCIITRIENVALLSESLGQERRRAEAMEAELLALKESYESECDDHKELRVEYFARVKDIE